MYSCTYSPLISTPHSQQHNILLPPTLYIIPTNNTLHATEITRVNGRGDKSTPAPLLSISAIGFLVQASVNRWKLPKSRQTLVYRDSSCAPEETPTEMCSGSRRNLQCATPVSRFSGTESLFSLSGLPAWLSWLTWWIALFKFYLSCRPLFDT